jgi:glycosyltransferase involved in cell wall biosynthesis
MSRIDVIIPSYNYARFLPACVESVLTQPVADLRVLVLDDASADNTAEVAVELMARDPRLEYRRHTVNRGHIATYNEGLEWAAGDYTLLISADDLLTPAALDRVVWFLDRHPEVVLACGQQVVFESGRPLPKPCLVPPGPEARVLTGQEFIEKACSSGNNPVATPTAVVRTGLIRQIEGYRPELPHTADLELWLRCALHGSVGILAVDQAYKRMHGRNMQLEYVGLALADVRQRKAAFDLLFQEHGDRIPDHARLHKLATRNIAEEAAFWEASRAFDRGDLGRYREFLLFALAAYPELPSCPEWSRLKWKRRLGRRVWSVARAIIARLRRLKATVIAS